MVDAIFVLEKETKNTYRFAEVAEGKSPIMVTAYIQKWLFKTVPKKVKITVEILE